MPRYLIRIAFALATLTAGAFATLAGATLAAATLAAAPLAAAQTETATQAAAPSWSPAGASAASRAEPFVVSATRTGDALSIIWTTTPDAYLYREKFGFMAQGVGPLRAELPAGVRKDDPTFGLVEVYPGGVTATLPASELKRVAGAGQLELAWQGCDERLGVCYPPERRTLDLATLEITATPPASAGASAIDAMLATPVSGQKADAPDASPSAQPRPGVPLKPGVQPMPSAQPSSAPVAAATTGFGGGWLDGSLLAVLATFLGFGLLLTFTPCVLPMIPILSGMLLRSGQQLAPARAFVLSGVYVLAMATAYALLGVVAAWSGQNLQMALQTPWALGAMSALFAALALSMFGLFDLQVPSALVSRITGRTAGLGGSLPGAAALGFTSALIVGPCVTPPLAGALLYVSQTGDAARGAAALFALGLGMGLPLIAWGTFGPRALPRSGPWLVWVKQAFGVVFLGIAIAMLSRVIPPQLSMALWAVLAIGSGVFLGAFGPARDGAGPKLARTAGVTALLYGAALLAGAAGGADNPLRPLGFLARAPDAGVAGAIAAETAAAPAGVRVTTPTALNEAIAAARAEGKVAIVDFTADWCTVCKEIDRSVFATSEVRARLETAAFIRVDLTDYSASSRALMQQHGVIGPPTIMFLGAKNGDELQELRSIGTIDAADFLRRLDLAGA